MAIRPAQIIDKRAASQTDMIRCLLSSDELDTRCVGRCYTAEANSTRRRLGGDLKAPPRSRGPGTQWQRGCGASGVRLCRALLASSHIVSYDCFLVLMLPSLTLQSLATHPRHLCRSRNTIQNLQWSSIYCDDVGRDRDDCQQDVAGDCITKGTKGTERI